MCSVYGPRWRGWVHLILAGQLRITRALYTSMVRALFRPRVARPRAHLAARMSDAPKPKPGPRVVRRVCANKQPSVSSSGGTSSGAGAQCSANPAPCATSDARVGGASKGGSWSQATATPQSWAPPAAKADPVDEELERVLKESLRMENARQETVATQVGARVEGNAIVPPDVGERAPLSSLPPPAGAGGALWEAKLRWLERTYGSMSSVRGATACGECSLSGYCHGSPCPGRPGLTLSDLGCVTHWGRAAAPRRAQGKAAVRPCGPVEAEAAELAGLRDTQAAATASTANHNPQPNPYPHPHPHPNQATATASIVRSGSG